jgi:hypothetical protein
VSRVTAPWTIVEYRGRTGLTRLEQDWRRLYAAMPLRTTFHAYDAQLAYVDHLSSAPERLRCLALRDGERVRAIALLEPRTERVLGVPVPVWGTPYHPHWPFSDIVCPDDDARRAFLPAAADYLRRMRSRRVLVLGPLPESSVVWQGLAGLPARRYCVHRVAEPYVFDCEKTFAELVAALSRSFRKDLRRCARNLDLLSDVRYESVTDGGDYGPLLAAFLRVEESGWKGAAGAGSAVGLHPELVAFYTALAKGLGAGDACEINALFADGHCIAGEFCMRTGGEYAALKCAYDERYARVSPGHLLAAHTLERCCDDPRIKRFNQLSDAVWLHVWRAGTAPAQQVHVATGLWGGGVIALLRFRFDHGRRLARWWRARRSAAERP